MLRVTLLIVASRQPGHIGNYIASGARQLGLDCRLLDTSAAEAKSRIGRSFYWRLRAKRPARMDRFAAQVLETCAAARCSFVLTTGFAPLDTSDTARRSDGNHQYSHAAA